MDSGPVFTFPFFILKSLHFTGLRDKFGLGLVFSLGLITIIVTTGRFIVMIIDVNDISLCESPRPLPMIQRRTD